MTEINFSRVTKARKLRRYFEQQGRIYIVIDATRQDVIVPEHLKEDPVLNLVLNIRMPQRIEIADDAVRSRFSFGGQSSDCEIPMDAIWASYVPGTRMDDGIVWEESMPDPIRIGLEMLAAEHDEEPAASPIATEDESAASPTATEDEPAVSPIATEDERPIKKARPQLRIVK